MPNWCYNYATFSHKDPEQMAKLNRVLEEQSLFDAFVPCPQELKDVAADFSDRPELVEKYGYSNWYEFNVNEWGTKWDINTCDILDDTEPTKSLTISFDTAWSPPIHFYEKMVEMGWEIDAEYDEEGMGFVGYFTNEDGDECYDLNFEHFDENWKDNFPERLHEMVERSYECWLDWQKEEEEHDESTDHADDH